MIHEHFSITADKEKREVIAVVKGKLQKEDVALYVGAYHKELAKIVAAEYSLIIDASSLIVTSQDLLPKLEKFFLMYKESGFKKVKFITESAVVGMQLKRIARMTNLDNAEVVIEKSKAL